MKWLPFRYKKVHFEGSTDREHMCRTQLLVNVPTFRQSQNQNFKDPITEREIYEICWGDIWPFPSEVGSWIYKFGMMP